MRLLIVLMLMLACLLPAVAAVAEESDKPTVSQSTYSTLAEAQKLTAKGEHGRAAEKLNALLANVQGRAYEEALTYEMLGYAHAGMKDYQGAARAFGAALATKALPAAQSRPLTYNLAQILVSDGQYQEGLVYLEEWLKGAGNPPYDARVLAAIAYYQSGNCNAAIPYLRPLAAEAKENGEQWTQALLGCYVEAKQYDRAAELLEQQLRAHPENNDNWMQLAAAYQQGDQDHKAMAVMELMLRRGALNREQIVNLARMYLAGELPYKAAELIRRQMDAGALPRDQEHTQLLIDSLLLAQEREQAAAVIQELLKSAPDGELYYKLGRLYFDVEKWPEAMAAFQRALQTSGLKDSASANLLLGIAAVHANQPAVAEHSLAVAFNSKGTRDQAEWWLQRLQRRQQPDGSESVPKG